MSFNKRPLRNMQSCSVINSIVTTLTHRPSIHENSCITNETLNKTLKTSKTNVNQYVSYVNIVMSTICKCLVFSLITLYWLSQPINLFCDMND